MCQYKNIKSGKLLPNYKHDNFCKILLFFPGLQNVFKTILPQTMPKKWANNNFNYQEQPGAAGIFRYARPERLPEASWRKPRYPGFWPGFSQAQAAAVPWLLQASDLLSHRRHSARSMARNTGMACSYFLPRAALISMGSQKIGQKAARDMQAKCRAHGKQKVFSWPFVASGSQFASFRGTNVWAAGFAMLARASEHSYAMR